MELLTFWQRESSEGRIRIDTTLIATDRCERNKPQLAAFCFNKGPRLRQRFAYKNEKSSHEMFQ